MYCAGSRDRDSVRRRGLHRRSESPERRRTDCQTQSPWSRKGAVPHLDDQANECQLAGSSAAMREPAAIAIQATLGVALSAPSAVPALGADAAPGNTATESQIKSVPGTWVISSVWNGGSGGFQSAGFPIAMMAGPVTLPRMTQIHKQLGRRVLPNQASVARA